MSFTLFEGISETSLTGILPEIIANSLPGFLVTKRWFGDKSRSIESSSLVAGFVGRLDHEWFAVLIADLKFTDGGSASYFVPLVVTPEGDPEAQLTSIQTLDGEWPVIDALQSVRFRRWLIDGLLTDETAFSGRLSWKSSYALGSVGSFDGDDSRISTAQQSNSSVIYDNTIMVKVFRKLADGTNPEIELGRFLTTKTSFRNMPAMLGSWSYLDGGNEISLAVAHRFVSGSGDAWSYIRDQIRGGSIDDQSTASNLGVVTARMHLAFESARDDKAMTPDGIDSSDVGTWSADLNRTLSAATDALRTTSGDHIQSELIETFLGLTGQLSGQTAGFEKLIGRAKIRVHGDLHLGQVLVTPEREFLVLDFEGEPQRSLSERRQKTSPLKDVAGMLRSFSYARGGAEREESSSEIPTPAELVQWERAARKSFLESYLAEARLGKAKFLPASNDDFRQAVAAWELDKALYEILYELNNRPDWLPIPLAGTLKLG